MVSFSVYATLGVSNCLLVKGSLERIRFLRKVLRDSYADIYTLDQHRLGWNLTRCHPHQLVTS